MYRITIVLIVILLAATTALSACARAPSSATTASARTDEATVPAPAAVDNTLPLIVVHKSLDCSCCALWVKHLRQAGFKVDVRNSNNLDPIKARLGVPPDKKACHTAEVGGYFVEGHVPADDIKRLLVEKPDAKGLAVPGMPAGSPGMEMPSGKTQPYDVLLVAHDNSGSTFSRHGDRTHRR